MNESVYTEGDIRGSENQGGAALAADWRCAHEKQALTWLHAMQMPAVVLCGLLHICSTQLKEAADNVPPVV